VQPSSGGGTVGDAQVQDAHAIAGLGILDTAAASARERTSSLRKADEMWVLTVLSARNSLLAIWPLVSPRTTSARISFSRCDSGRGAMCRPSAVGHHELARKRRARRGDERTIDVVHEDDGGCAGKQRPPQRRIGRLGRDHDQDADIRITLGQRSNRAHACGLACFAQKHDERSGFRLGPQLETRVLKEPGDVTARRSVTADDRDGDRSRRRGDLRDGPNAHVE
jgi:hypothetical protein